MQDNHMLSISSTQGVLLFTTNISREASRILDRFSIHYYLDILHAHSEELKFPTPQTECKELTYLVSASEKSAETI